ncbi:MAG: SelD-related putative sulfur metabolism protein [Nitrososphaeraceae archaeon]
MTEEFWQKIEEYRKLGFDPLRWVATGSNEIDIWTLNHAVKEMKRSSIKLDTNWYDAFHYADGKAPDLTRRVFSIRDPAVENEVELKHALAMFRVHKEIENDPSLFTGILNNFFRNFRCKVAISKTTFAVTEHRDAQFALLDYIGLHRGDKVGFTAADNATAHVIDPTLEPDSELHTDIPMTRCIDHLNLIGCTSGFNLYPIYDSPHEYTLDTIRKNLDAFTSRYNLKMDDYSSLKMGKLFFGATGIANTFKELPTNYDQIEETMQIIITNPLGSLMALSLFVIAQIDEKIISTLETKGVNKQDLVSAKDECMKNLSEPHFSLGKIISKYCPNFGESLQKNDNIIAVHPLGSDGILGLWKLARVSNCHLVVNDIPMMFEEIARLASSEALVANPTAAMNGCHTIVATKDITNTVLDELRKHNFRATVIGFVTRKGEPNVTFGNNVKEHFAANIGISILNKITGK